MIYSFLKRGFDWPLQESLRPNSKRQRKRITRWLESNEARLEDARNAVRAKGGWRYNDEHDYLPTIAQKEEWTQHLVKITGNMTNQEGYQRSQTIIRGLIKKIVEEKDCQAVKRFIPKDHWVYITLRYWLEEKKGENDQWAQAIRIQKEHEMNKELTMDEVDKILEEELQTTEKRDTDNPPNPLGKTISEKNEENGLLEAKPPTRHQLMAMETIFEEPSPVKGPAIEDRPHKEEQIHLSQIGDVNHHPLQSENTGCQSTQNEATTDQSLTQRTTEKTVPILGATNNQATHKECHTVSIYTVACERPTPAKSTGKSTTDQPLSITPRLIDPLAFTRRHIHYPATLEEDLLTGQYACMDTSSPIKHYIDWSTYKHKDNWSRNITQEIMENRALSLHDWETDVWANTVDEELKLTYIDENAEEWHITTKQSARITHHMRSAADWFKQQPMQIRLHRLNTGGWLAKRLYYYVQGRVTWPWQLGPPPNTDVEHRLIELWHNSIKQRVHAPPSPIQEYTAWWQEAEKQTYSQQQLLAGTQLIADAKSLAIALNKIPTNSPIAQQVYYYVTKGTAWPISHLPQQPYSQLQLEVVTSWWTEHRERLDQQYGPRYTSQAQQQAQALWHNRHMHSNPSRIIPSRSRTKGYTTSKPRRQRTPSKKHRIPTHHHIAHNQQ